MNLDTDATVLGGLDPDLQTALTRNRRSLLADAALRLGVIASAPLILALSARHAFGADLPEQIVDTLNFALSLEHIEDAFYRTALDAKLIPDERKVVFQQIGLHEAAHVALLESVLGAAAVKRPEFDFTAAGKYPDVFTNFATFLTLSMTFEDLGVAAYKGQAGTLIGNSDILTVALQIHSVEARHAAMVRRIGGKKAWDEAFDMPMTKKEVLAAAKPFLKE